jgi:hypothetical protein
MAAYMGYIVPGVLVLIIIACIAQLQAEGLWGNLLNLVNTVLAAIVTMNFGGPLFDLASNQFDSAVGENPGSLMLQLKESLNFLVLWLLFGGSVTIFRQISRYVSRVKVRFRKPVELAGNYILAIAVGWVAVCFTGATLNAAPESVKAAMGDVLRPDNAYFFGFRPDAQLMSLGSHLAEGSLSRNVPSE